MNITLNNKVAIVTGGTRGIGFAMIKAFVEADAKVVIWGSRIETAESALEKLKGLYPDCEAMAMAPALTDQKQVREAMEEVVRRYGRIDILVNNAGITRDGLMLRMTEEQWDSVINANLKSAFNYIHACLPIMMRQRKGSIINMSSIVGMHGNAGQANYAASKAGMIALAKSVAQEMGPKGIRLNTIAPGFVETAMTASLPDEIREEWKKKIPLRRAGQPEDIANTALFLASDLSSYVTGQVIQVDGGMNM